MNKKLKSCPYCGGEAEIMQLDFIESILKGTWIIGCDGIKGSMCPGYIYKCSPVYTSEELAIQMWNSRNGKDSEVVRLE
jgi:hypothetical protein